jgi:hypothetical protein
MSLGRVALEFPPRLLVLISTIVPSIDEMSFPQCPEPLTSVKRSTDLALRATNRGLASVGS